MTNVIIFEDHKHLRETLSLLVNSSGKYSCVGAFPNCKDILPLIEFHRPAIVLMDIEMPGMNGVEATKLIKNNFPEVQVLIQTVFYEDEHIFNAICAGASGYILKSTSPEGYILAMDDIRSGGSPMTPGIARRMLELFKTNLSPASIDYNLTTQEKKVLQLLVEGKSYKMIASELFVAHDTVKSHIRNIYAKLHVNSGTEAVAKALRDKIV